MSSPALRRTLCCLVLLFAFSCLTASAQSTGGRITGKVSDPTGAVVSGVNVKLTNVATGVSREVNTNDNGDYTFVEVVPGNYRAEYSEQGFKKYVRDNVTLEVNQVLTLNATLQPGGTQEVVEVTSEAPLVDTTSTQLGAVVDDRMVNQLPLNTRDTYQFLQLQPGVMSTVGSSNSIVYGSNNAGAVSVNGGRGRSNNFSVNGGDANDQFVNLPTVQPTPDSIQEFRVLTNTFDAEYGRNSGSVVNVVTKSGTNKLHGDLYEYFRNKSLNASPYCFSQPCVKPQFNQNQFGGTLGGPVKKDRTFFFVSYEGRRIRQGIPSPNVTVPTTAQRPSATQNYSDFSALDPFGGSLNDDFVAQTLNSRPGCASALGGPIPLPSSTQSGSVPWSTVFPGNIIPLACMDPTAVDLLQFLPASGNSSGTVVTTPVEPVRGDQFTLKFDHRISNSQNFSGYYYFDDDHQVLPFAQFEAAGANVPGFASIVGERFQQWNLTHTWTINNTTVNEFRFNYNREAQRTFQHPERTSLIQDSCPAAPSWLTQAIGTPPCFFGDGSSDPVGSLYGIHPNLGPNHEGLPFIQISGGATIGNNGEGELPQVGNSFQWSDSVSKIVGTHTFKFGGDLRRQRFDQTLYFDVNGEFFYSGSGNNSVVGSNGSNFYPDFLLGLPDSFGQGSAQVERVRSTATYLFAQDSWKIKPNLTLNYGLRWEFTTPITDISQHVQTFRPGEQTKVYPCKLDPNLDAGLIATYGSSDCSPTGPASAVFPTGLVVPGDPGIPGGLTQTYYKAFAPRIGIAWSPGTSSKTSIRAGWGLFYNPIEQLVLEQFSAEPPFGVSTFPANTFFNTPYQGQDGVTNYPNAANGILQAPRGQPVDWALFRPILLFGQFQPHMRSQYSAQYNFTIQRELSKDMKLEVGYVGSQGHRLLATHDLNYGNPQTCLDLQNIANYYDPNVPNNPHADATLNSDYTCGQYYADSAFGLPANSIPAGFSLHLPNGQVLNGPNAQPMGLVGLRKYSSPQCNPVGGYDPVNQIWTNGCPADGVPVFSSIFAQDTIANSAYNSLQASLDKRFAHGLQFTAAYTFSKSIDQASSFEGILNPIDPRRSRALSAFDARHRLVFSYYWALPIAKHEGLMGKFVDGWGVSGITTFQTGFPIRITSQADNELMYSFDFELPGEPDQIAPFKKLRPQSNGNYFFDPTSFTEDTTVDPSLFGRIGNAPRTICCGPRISESDFSVLKNIPFTESKYMEFRADFFNIFNHTQFYNPDGDSSDGGQFGQVTQARDPRLMQFALKLYF